ncbi:MAG TPA: DUF2796 domain-containing protein [Rudaea sp.]|nr:DUF2796 domain-containing protein [Rudaea sp.]
MPLATHANATTPVLLHIEISATDIVVSFELSGNEAVGFQHRQRTAAEKSSVAQAMTTLTNPGQWIHLNAEAQCNSSVSSVAANIFRIVDPEAPKPKVPITKPAFDTSVTFSCRMPQLLRSADVTLISAFPRVREVTVDVHAPAGNRTSVVTTPTATVALTPN